VTCLSLALFADVLKEPDQVRVAPKVDCTVAAEITLLLLLDAPLGSTSAPPSSKRPPVAII
jgi:hypothetical protein